MAFSRIDPPHVQINCPLTTASSTAAGGRRPERRLRRDLN
jgi:hypothetical protein